jgi:hypothetical protein
LAIPVVERMWDAGLIEKERVPITSIIREEEDLD